MNSTLARAAGPSRAAVRPSAAAITAAVIVVACCLTFAMANVILETTGGLFDGGQYAQVAGAYPVGLAVANGLVFTMKVVVALAAILSVTRLPRSVRPPLVGMVLWATFATLAVYSLGNVAETIGILAGLRGSPDMINVKTLAYVAFFLVFAAPAGVLAVSFTRRYALRKRYVLFGALGAPVVLGGLLVALPALLAALGLFPTA